MAASRRAQAARQMATLSQTRPGTFAANFATDDAIRRRKLSSLNRESVIGRRIFGEIGAGCSPGTPTYL
jgi:hypothetical protein